MHAFPHDVRYALRMLRKSPGSTLAILVSLAIGIGANSAVFSVVNALLLRPLPYPQPERLAAIWLHSPGIGIFRDWPSPGQYVDLRTANHSFDDMALARTRSMTLLGFEQPERIDGIRTQSSLLRMLGGRPLIGRLLLPEEDQPGKPPVAILSERLWRRLFQADPHIIGKSINLNGNSVTVAGVLNRKFLLNNEVLPSEGPMDKVDVFLPLPLGADAVNRRGDENYNIVVRLKAGVSIQQAQADVDVIAARIREKDKRDRTFGMHVVGLRDQVVGDVRRVLLVLFGSVGLVLVIACANVANLMLARAGSREKEVAVRTALGAGWTHLMRQLLVESLMLAASGGIAGLALAEASLYLVRMINPGNIPRLEEIGINGTVLAFTFGMSIVTGVLFGLTPIWRVLNVDLNASLKSGGRSGRNDAGLNMRRNRLRGLLVVSEIALSLMLLIGAGLLIRSFVRLQSVPPGFRTDRVLSMCLATSGLKYRDEKAVVETFREIERRVASVPGVSGEGLISVLPLAGSIGWGQINVEGYHPAPGQELQVDIRTASTDYFRTMAIPLLKGRFFSGHDTHDSQQVVIVDENFARRFWPRENPLGKHLWFDHPEKPFTIVGVVGVVKQYGLETEGKIVTYFSNQQFPDGGSYLVAHSGNDAGAVSSAIIREIHGVDPTIVVYDVQTMKERLYRSLARQRFASASLGAFALFALLLATVGVYGVLSYVVTQGTHDIGVRMALGAVPNAIVRLVVREGMALAATGAAAGLAGAAVLTRLMAGLLFGISTHDVVTFGGVTVLLLAIAFAASVIPATRASALDPMVALREE